MANTPNDKVDDRVTLVSKSLQKLVDRLDDVSSYVLEANMDADLTPVNQFSAGTARSVNRYLDEIREKIDEFSLGVLSQLHKIQRDVAAGKES